MQNEVLKSPFFEKNGILLLRQWTADNKKWESGEKKQRKELIW